MAAYRYWRLVVTRWRDAGTDTSSVGHVRVSELQFVTAGGTVWPQAALTSATAPAPYVVTASANESGFPPYRAFDGVASDSNRWLSGQGITSAWLQIDMGQALDFVGIRYAPDGAATLNGGYFSVDFEVWASATGVFAGEHVICTQYAGVTSGWSGSTLREFAFNNVIAYPISETFTTGIPVGFASAAGSGMTATYDSGNQAAQLVGGAAIFPLWTIGAAPLSGDFFIEFDLELVSDASAIRHLGLWLLTGNGYEGYRVAQQGGQPYNIKLSSYNAAGIEVATWTTISAENHLVGVRKTWRADYVRAGGIGRMVLSLGGVPIFDCLDTSVGTTMRPAVFAYGCTVRVHSVVANTGSAYPYAAPGGHNLPVALVHSSNGAQGNQPGPPHARGFGMGLLRRNHWQGGNGRVRGTVAEKGTPNAPVHRKVRLFHEATGVLVAEVWSDVTTGAYSFDNIDASPQKYTVLSYDYTGAFRAVVADGQIPEVMA